MVNLVSKDRDNSLEFDVPVKWEEQIERVNWKDVSITVQATAQKMKFPVKVFFSKSDQTAVSCGFGHIKWKNA